MTMNYQYIEQLLERYFDCQATLQEEQILRSFFAQEDVPGHLMQYAELFQYESTAHSEGLGSDFDKRMLDLIEKQTPRKASIIKMHPRLAPFCKAAAVVAVAITIGNAAEHAIGNQQPNDGASCVAVDPYIKTSDIRSTLRIKDVSKAEMKAVTDTLLNISGEKQEEVQ